jgi:cell division protein FtsN
VCDRRELLCGIVAAVIVIIIIIIIIIITNATDNVLNLSSFRSYNENKNNNSWCDESNQKFTLLGVRDV